MLCNSCMAWIQLENQPEWGECHRHAPSPRTGPDSSNIYGPFNLRGIWPYTRAVDHCHEYISMAEMHEEMEEYGMEEVPPPISPDQALTPDKFIPENSGKTFAQVVEEAVNAVQ